MNVCPLELWWSVYETEESIASESETLRQLSASLDNGPAIQAHIENMRRALAKINPAVAARYEPWCLRPENYTYGSEAYYQSRVLAQIRHLQETHFDTQDSIETICVRQTLKPSAFNGTPRVKRIPPIAFIVFPAPTVYWMYEIFGMISSFMGHGVLNSNGLDQYLLYLIGARTFERFATHETAFAIDFLIDAIAHIDRDVQSSDSNSEIQTTSCSQQLIYAAEEFVLAHELAHCVLGHKSTNAADAEVEADRRAIEMMLAINSGAFDWVDDPPFHPDLTPWLGYLAIRLWTNVRLSSELRVVPWVYDNVAEIEYHKNRIAGIFRSKIAQIKQVGITLQIPTPKGFRELTNASQSLIDQICEHTLDAETVTRVKNTAVTLAKGDFDAFPDLYVPGISK